MRNDVLTKERNLHRYLMRRRAVLGGGLAVPRP
jgi:hypothetical protein